MKFAIPTAAVLAFISSAFAQATAGFDAITYPTDQEVLSAGSTYTITWDPTATYNGQTVSIILLEGATQDTLLLGPTIAASIDSGLGKASWTVDSSVVGSALYGLKLQLDSNTSIFQYSFPFQIQGSTISSTTATSISTVSSASIASTSSVVAQSSSIVASSSSVDQVQTSSTAASSTSTTQVTTTSTVASTTATRSATGGKASATGAATTLTTLSKPSSTGSATTSASPTFVTAGAAKVAAGSFMAVGGVMAAVLAM